MSKIINENLTQALRGGVPGTYTLVRSFVGLRLQGEYLGLQDGTIDDRPLWPMVYYCIRSGDLSAAIYCLRKSGLPEFQDLVSILEAKLNNPSSPEIAKLEDNIRFSYRRVVRNDTDPFKRIVWSVLGCCDVSDEHSEVARAVEDYLWLKLSLVRVDYNKDDYVKYEGLQVSFCLILSRFMKLTQKCSTTVQTFSEYKNFVAHSYHKQLYFFCLLIDPDFIEVMGLSKKII